MNWLARMDYKYGRKAPKRMTLVLVVGQIISWLVMLFFYAMLPIHMALLREPIFRGEVWRLFSFLFIPVEITTNPLVFALGTYLVYFIGSSLENAWGSFKFDVYLGLGILGAWLSCLLVGIGGTHALYYSLFFAFAYLFPDTQLLLFFVIPIKVKWLGVAAVAVYLVDLFTCGSWLVALSMVVGLLNFLVFFGAGGTKALIGRIKQSYRRYQWKKQWRDR